MIAISDAEQFVADTRAMLVAHLEAGREDLVLNPCSVFVVAGLL